MSRPVDLVGDVDPVLIRGQRHVDRAEGHVLQTLRELGRLVAAGLACGVGLDGKLDRGAVPVRDLDSRLELRVTGDVVEGLGHQVRRAAVDDAAFEEDAQEREARVARGQDVVGVQVAQAKEDPLQLHVELRLGEFGQLVPQEAERLQRVDGVHGALEGQMGVDLSDQDLGLIQHDTALRIGERALGNVVAELRHRAHGAQVVVCGEDDGIGVGHDWLLGERRFLPVRSRWVPALIHPA